MQDGAESWGRYPRAQGQRSVALVHRDATLPSLDAPMLAYGNGRSYGDSCLNPQGWLLRTRGLDRFIGFDPANGVLRCEAGVTLGEIIALVLPHGWFLPVTPGTRYVTVGGAIANDVHGKNHHVAGSFGEHVRAFELLRSDGERRTLAPGDALFAASVGGLGLTGLITWAELQLRRVPGPWLATTTTRFDTLDDFFALSREAGGRHEYTVAWIDCLASGASLGRGHFITGDHASALHDPPTPPRATRLGVPFTPPLSLVNGLSLRPFNTLYYHRQRARRRSTLQHYGSYFYPLDGIHRWNRLYGPRGFLQHQCVLPPATARDALHAMLTRIAASGRGSFLAVLKEFGDRPAPGLLSFARAGSTLALDFPNDGEGVFALLDRLDAIVAEAGGAIYPAKDARQSPALFRAGFPAHERFAAFVDPHFSSAFWRRVSA